MKPKSLAQFITIVSIALFPPIARGADVQYFALSDTSAVAEFAVLDTNTCSAGILTYVAVQAGFNAARSPGATERLPIAAVFIDRYDFCRNIRLASVSGDTTNFDLRINPNLKTASLHARILVSDVVTSTSSYADVDVVWTGTGMADHDSFNETTQLPGVTITTHSQGAIREGVASGSVIWLGTDVTPELSTSAYLQKNASTEVTITRQ